MALLQELIKQIDNEALRLRITAEVDKLTKQKKFGLVFEEHIPECTPLYDVDIRRDSKVALKTGQVSDIYIVRSIDGDKAICEHKTDHAEVEFALDDLVAVAEFGEPIYPYLKPIDTVCNAPDSDLWHTLIEADNYHALQLLEYLYAGKVDCIYIDPPYNTGARDWKYNNDYVDGSDAYRHSKWLSFMEKRLKLAKKLLNPKDSVLIVTIDEKEYLHLGCLLEELFPDARMQMVSSIIKPEGTQRRNEFSRTNEFIFFIMFGDSVVPTYTSSMFEDSGLCASRNEKRQIEWPDLRRRNRANVRSSRPNQFYPIFINTDTGFINSIGDALPPEQDRNTVPAPNGCYAFYPIAPDGREMLWGKHYSTARDLLAKGYIKTENGKNPSKVKVRYLASGTVADIDSGEITITGRGEQNEIVGEYVSGVKYYAPKSIWNLSSHNAQTNGSLIIKSVIGDNRFSFPKSLYAVYDCVKLYTQNKPNALIIDFFAGSGTTLHAVNLLNAEDGGHRRCIMVTNNEVSDAETNSLTKQGKKPGDEEWEKLGIARYVTWPRTVCSIEGHDMNGNPLTGDYGTYHEEYISDEQRGKYKKVKVPDNARLAEMKMADGFKANAAYFKLGFLDKASIRIGRHFREMLPTLWMKAGCFGPCPKLEDQKIPDYMVLPENHMAILNDNSCFAKFAEEVGNAPEIETIYLVTDSDADYRSMSRGLKVKQTYQLYRDYLDNFRINSRR